MRPSEDKTGMMTEASTKASAGNMNVLAAFDVWGQLVSCVNYILAVVAKSEKEKQQVTMSKVIKFHLVNSFSY